MTGAIYSGDMPETFGALLGRDPSGGVGRLFAGRRAGFAFSTRVAILRACSLLRLSPGDEVLAPAYNCGSELDPLRHFGVTVTLYPVDRQTGIDPDEVERRITARTRAVYLIHYFGVLHPATAALRALCDRHGLALIEDCALSLLSGAQPAEGRQGDVALFCLYKFFPTLAGGALVVNAPAIAGTPRFSAPPPRREVLKHLVRMGMHAVPGLDQLRRRGRKLGEDLTVEGGHPDMPASYYFDPALTDTGISRLALWPMAGFDVKAAIAARRAHYRTYLALLEGVPRLRPLFPDLAPETCPLSLPVLVEDRDRLSAAMQARGIAAPPWWAGYHRGLDFAGQTEACFLKDHVLSLPVHQYLGAEAPAHVVGTLCTLLRQG